MHICRCKIFMHDEVSCHWSRVVQNFFEDQCSNIGAAKEELRFEPNWKFIENCQKQIYRKTTFKCWSTKRLLKKSGQKKSQLWTETTLFSACPVTPKQWSKVKDVRQNTDHWTIWLEMNREHSHVEICE